MRKIICSILAVVISGIAIVSSSLVTIPVFAASGETCSCEDGGTGEMVPGAILHYCDCGHGEGIKAVLKLVVRIMTVGIAILGAIGLAISGIQYLTAGGNEEKTRKAKRRVFELVIGLVAYALMYSLLSFFLPGFNS